MTDEERKQAEDAIKEAYREYQFCTQGIDVWEEGAFRAGWDAALKVAGATKEMYLNMQYYMEYCQMKGYVTPQEWIEKHKHF